MEIQNEFKAVLKWLDFGSIPTAPTIC